EDKQPGARGVTLLLQQQAGEVVEQPPVARPVLAGQEACEGGAVAALGAVGGGGGGGGHAAAAVEEGDEEAQQQAAGGDRQPRGAEERLDLGEGVGEDHRDSFRGAEGWCVVTHHSSDRSAPRKESFLVPNNPPEQTSS